MNLIMNPYQNMFEKIESWLPNPPIDYFDFPASATAFCLSLKNSVPFFYRGGLFRHVGNSDKLISFQGNDPVGLVQPLLKAGHRVKSVSFAFRSIPKDVQTVSSKSEYFVTFPYNFKERISFHSRINRGRLKRDYRQGTERYNVTHDVQPQEFQDLFETWLQEAQDRHFMVRKGHHRAYANLYFSNVGGIRLLGFRRKTDGLLCGVMGFEIVGDQAQMTLGKHRLGDNALSTFYYVRTLEIIGEMGIKRVFCGSSTDEFKQRIGLEYVPSWKPILTMEEGDEENEATNGETEDKQDY